MKKNTPKLNGAVKFLIEGDYIVETDKRNVMLISLSYYEYIKSGADEKLVLFRMPREYNKKIAGSKE